MKKEHKIIAIVAAIIIAIIVIAGMIKTFRSTGSADSLDNPTRITTTESTTRDISEEPSLTENTEDTTKLRDETDSKVQTESEKTTYKKTTTTRESTTKPAKSESKLEMATYAQVAAEDVLKQRVVLPSMSDITVDGVEPRYIIKMKNAKIGNTKNREIIVKIEFVDSDHEQYDLMQLKVDGKNIDF